MAKANLTDFPPELLDHITTYLPSARSLRCLGKTNKALHTFVEKDAWQTFARTHFPSLIPSCSPSYKDASRTLTTLSKAWDRRGLVARYIEPQGNIRAFPGNKPVERWKKPRGQTIGYTPQLDVYEDIGSRWQDREETLAFSAGAEVCIRKNKRDSRGEHVRWLTYRPLSAHEGRDDITTLHLLRPEHDGMGGNQRMITGTANGDLQLLSIPGDDSTAVPITYFTTQGQSVRSTSLLQRPSEPSLLAANMGDSRVSIYSVDMSATKIEPLSSIDILAPQTPNGERQRLHRVWSAQLMSPHRLAAGIGPSSEPIHVYNLSATGIDKDPLRKFSLENDLEAIHGARLDQISSAVAVPSTIKKSTSSVYPIVPLPPASTTGGSTTGDVFLSGAYDSVIRLHDLRSKREFEQSYTDPTDDSAIYSLLPRGQETLVAGTSRHSLLKFFDMRMGRKCYIYLDASTPAEAKPTQPSRTKNWNLFLKPTNATYPGRGGGNNWSRRSQESSVYSLASSSPHSPHIYAGVESAVVDLAFTSFLDRHPDPVHFSPWKPAGKGKEDSWRSREVLDLAMYDQSADMKLHTQRSLWATWRGNQNPVGRTLDFPRVEGLDERWRVGSGP
ncbi:hypothetical protein LTR78_004074 [Recurvomyces mirabilis]|uniref:F-box domain-containing protein n=1 Tax=Recurvomyces mirabilis TaxID=574656 RepID=A0AAE1C2V2_9PEZI|nr:hypothetical protein LTR78_004074 [Recurvomyces mirabilis]KAK5153754.1 hypothetical protein LTS14_007448 [Recurvomyces mirabilis]